MGYDSSTKTRMEKPAITKSFSVNQNKKSDLTNMKVETKSRKPAIPTNNRATKKLDTNFQV